ncbi:HAD family hydrolase [Agreia sp. Leaf335]|uniref:HAD family hydrolase n=1 Tax=Agreia sp. Leaf335 TaxID=1736340 RepID=UPI001F350026|nr:HAD family phosphatase [Agreia sp. Leaf335]
MDGVIVDTPALHRRVWSEFVNTAPWPEVREYRPGAAGRRSKDVLTELLGERLSDDEIDDVVAGLHTKFLHLAASEDRVFPAMRSFIRSASGRIPLAIATSAPGHVVRGLLGELVDSVDVTITSDDCRAGKPNPEVYLRARRAMGLEQRNVLVVEDTGIGVRAGVAADCDVWAIAVSPDAASACHEAGASVMARGAAQMASILALQLQVS